MITEGEAMSDSRKFAHVCLLVEDLEQSVKDYSKILSALDPQQLKVAPIYFYDAGVEAERFDVATFVSAGCEIQLMQPKTPDTPLYRRLQKRGEHVHHICFTSPSVEKTALKLEEAGVGIVPQGIVFDPQREWSRWTFVDPQQSHGVLIEVANNYRAEGGTWVPGDGVEA
jgi:methylmalonyl-CoA/ethylmalonyl-CoA epimerase